jgi:hypothetical protein
MNGTKQVLKQHPCGAYIAGIARSLAESLERRGKARLVRLLLGLASTDSISGRDSPPGRSEQLPGVERVNPAFLPVPGKHPLAIRGKQDTQDVAFVPDECCLEMASPHVPQLYITTFDGGEPLVVRAEILRTLSSFGN